MSNTRTLHAPHPVTDLPSLADDPACEEKWVCPDPECSGHHNPQDCGNAAAWVWIRPCRKCKKPVSTLVCGAHRKDMLKAGIKPAAFRPL